MIGRTLWDLFAGEIHAVPAPTVPALAIALVAVSALVLAVPRRRDPGPPSRTHQDGGAPPRRIDGRSRRAVRSPRWPSSRRCYEGSRATSTRRFRGGRVDRHALAAHERADRRPPRRARSIRTRRTRSIGAAPPRRCGRSTHAHGGGFFDVPERAHRRPRRGRRRVPRRRRRSSTCRRTSSTPRDGSARARPRSAASCAWPIPTAGRATIDPRVIDGAAWAALVFGASETAIALLTSTPGPAAANVLTNAQIAAARDVVDRYAGHRTRAHAHDRAPQPRRRRARRDGRLARALRPSGWKVLHALRPADEGVADRRLVPRRRRDRLPVPRAGARARPARRRGAQGPRRPDPRRSRSRPRRRATSARPRPRSPTSRSSCTTPATSAIPTAQEGPYDAANATARRRPARQEPRAAPASARAATCTPSSAARGS